MVGGHTADADLLRGEGGGGGGGGGGGLAYYVT